MQIRPGPWMGQRHLLVQLDAEPRLLRRDDESIFPSDWLLEDLSMEAVPALDALEDEKVRAAGCELNLGRAANRPVIELRCDLRIVGFSHAGDLLRIKYPADAAKIHLQDRRGAGFEHARE